MKISPELLKKAAKADNPKYADTDSWEWAEHWRIVEIQVLQKKWTLQHSVKWMVAEGVLPEADRARAYHSLNRRLVQERGPTKGRNKATTAKA